MMNDFPRLYGNQQEKPFEPSMPISTAMQEAGGAIDELRKELPQYDAATAAMMRHLQILTQAVETVQQHCSNVMQERDQYSSMLTVAQQRLTEVQRVVQRYTVVQDPVVASDGFTYERRTIQQYIDDCARTRAAPVSQQTREELTNTLVPNQSLKKLVDLLKSVKADAPMPQAGNKDHHHGSSGGADLLHGGGGYHQNATSNNNNNGAARGGAGANHSSANNNGSNEGRLHPCNRVYGFCNYKESCTFAPYPYDACLSFLKGKCRFGAQCHELHVDFRRPKKDGQH